MENSKNIICPKCGSQDLVVDTEKGEEVCGRCGLVVSDRMLDVGPDWRAFTNSEREKRPRASSGESLIFYDKGLSTKFEVNRDAQGRRLTLEEKNRMNKLRLYDARTKIDDSWARNLSIAMSELDRLSTILHIPVSVKEHAAFIYRKALQHDLIRGRSIDAFVAASIYAACRFHNLPRTLKRISQVSTREHAEVSRSYRLLIRELNLRMPIDDPMKFIPSIAAKLKIRHDTEMEAINILHKAKKVQGLSGKDPRGLAAAALYIACIENNDKRVQKDVASAAGTTEVTLRNRLRGLESLLKTVQNSNKIDFG